MGGELTEPEFETLVKFSNKNISCFVETGTYKGHTSRRASRFFKKVHTIEIFEPLYRESIESGRGIENIEYHLGDSMVLLPKIAMEVGPAVWFLDAHISGSDSSWNKTVPVPLLQELELILTNNTSFGIFILDDVRFFGTSTWPNITRENILGLFEKFNKTVIREFIENDRFYIIAN